jgi:hypothetical protein
MLRVSINTFVSFFLVMFEAFGFSGVPPHCRNLSQLPSSEATLVVELALSDLHLFFLVTLLVSDR